jgi:hypothetical protein
MATRRVKKGKAERKAPIRTAQRKTTPKSVATEKGRKHKGLLTSIGGIAGTAFGGPSGGLLGAAAGDILGDLFGWGDYETAPVGYAITNNTTLGLQTPEAAQIPMMHTENGCCRISKREYITDVNMTADFSIDYFGLNPTDARTFPWLSTVARNFEQFKFLGVSFGFRSLSANALSGAGTPAMGSITLLTQYDLYDSPALNKTEANNALYATSCKPSESMLHPIECDPEQTPNIPLYTGVNEAPILQADRDLRLNYLGVTTVCTQGGPTANYLCGELWVTYDIMLYKPMIQHRLLAGEPRTSLADEMANRLRITIPSDGSDAATSTDRSQFTFVSEPSPLPTPRSHR